jgi:hypothetical protein
MPDGHDCLELPTIINNVEYLLQSRTIAAADGAQYIEYRVLLNGEVIKSWTPGDIRAYFSIP